MMRRFGPRRAAKIRRECAGGVSSSRSPWMVSVGAVMWAAAAALRFAVRPAVVGDHVEPTRQEVLRDTDARAAVVGDAVKDDDGAALGRGVKPPALQLDAGPFEFDGVDRTVRLSVQRMSLRVQQRIRGP